MKNMQKLLLVYWHRNYMSLNLYSIFEWIVLRSHFQIKKEQCLAANTLTYSRLFPLFTAL